MPRKSKKTRLNTNQEENLYDQKNKHQYNIIDFDRTRQKQRKINVIPRTLKQEEYVVSLEDESKYIIMAVGPAGCGKTLLATQYAIKSLWDGKIDKIVITRPSLPSEGEDIGFLPGSALEKMMPWVRPILDIFAEYYSPKEIQRLVEQEVVELCPIAFIRGRTFKNSFIIVDEAQNLTPLTFKAALTRIGENSRMVVTGDLEQGDRGDRNGLKDFIDRYNGTSDHIKVVQFSKNDQQRHPIIKEILHIYKDPN